MLNETRSETARLEQTEAGSMWAVESGAPAAVRSALGIRTERIGGGVVLGMSHDVTGYWNKALGFGLDSPVTAETIDEVISFFGDHGASEATVQIAPHLLPADWSDICTRQGLAYTSHWAKLAGPVDEVVARAEALVAERPGLDTETVTDSDTDEWGAVCMRGFGFPEQHYAPMMAAFANHPGVIPFAARQDGRIVGAASLRVEGSTGHLFACSMLPEAYRHGGQTALLLARARAARDAGCRWLVAETEAERPGKHVTSFHNMKRVGMTMRYERPNWRWQADSPNES